MNSKIIVLVLAVLFASFALSACAPTFPVPVTLEGSGAPQVVTLERSAEASFEQVDYQTLPAYQAHLAGFQMPASSAPSIDWRFEQIPDCQTLAEYQAYIAGFQMPPNPN